MEVGVIGATTHQLRDMGPSRFYGFCRSSTSCGISVILDWVPAHSQGWSWFSHFDGTALFEHADPRKGEQLDWGTLVYNYGRAEVYRTF